MYGRAKSVYNGHMTTNTIPSADRIPAGFFVSSSVGDRKLEWGSNGETIGDWIEQTELVELVELDMQEEAGFKQCENCDHIGPSVKDVQVGRDDYIGLCEDCRENVEYV
jgi:hypothetical protein